MGPKLLDLDRGVEYPTLARLAVARQMDYEMAAEELRLLYVAMTRAKEKLILSCALTGGRDADKLLPSAGTPTEPQALLNCASPAQWVLLPVLARPEAGALRGEGLLPPAAAGTRFGPAWDLRWVDGASLAETPAGRMARREETAPEEGGRICPPGLPGSTLMPEMWSFPPSSPPPS